MLKALLERGIKPDLIVGTSVGALNGAIIAADPTLATVERLVDVWSTLSRRDVFGGGLFGQLGTLVRHGTHLHGNEQLRRRLDEELGGRTFAELTVPFQCVAASIERAGARWFNDGPVADAVLAASPASCQLSRSTGSTTSTAGWSHRSRSAGRSRSVPDGSTSCRSAGSSDR